MTNNDKNTATLQALLKFALPLGTNLAAGDADTEINWAVTVRAQPPAFPDIYGGELALISMDLLRSYDNRISLSEVVHSLAEASVGAVAVDGDVSQTAITVANERNIALLILPEKTGLPGIERAVNKLILNQSAQLTERAVEIQRQLTRISAENKDMNTLLQVISRAIGKPVLMHDDAGVIKFQVYPTVSRRGMSGRSLIQNLPYIEFQKWLDSDAPGKQGTIVGSPLGYTTVLQVEKRVSAYLSIVARDSNLDDFDRLVLAYGADVCSIELAKTRAIESAVEQARGDWVQMWLSGASGDDDLLATRAGQAGFNPQTNYFVVVFRAITDNGQTLPLESLISLVRDDMARRQIEGAVGQYVDVIVALYPIDKQENIPRIRIAIEELRQQLAMRTPSGLVASGISRPAIGLRVLRDSYRESKDAVSIAQELGDFERTTYYGDLKLYQLLLALKEYNLDHMSSFYSETLEPLVEHDERKQSDLIRTLTGFFDANGNLAQAAKDLDVHRNTLVYRLERISELTQLDLNDADNRLILHLALKIQRVLATISGRVLG